MADGITQVGGNGGSVLFQNDSHADAGGDGEFSWDDIWNAVLTKGFKAADGVTPAVVKLSAYFPVLAAISREIYVSLVTLQNGDGAGSAPTTLKDTDKIVAFATGKTYVVSNVGVATRTTTFGVKIPGSGKPTGRNGVQLFLGAAPTWRGNFGLYGSYLRVAGNMVFQPAATGLTCEIVNALIEATGSVGLGTAAGELSLLYNVDLVSLGAGASGGLVQFNVTNAERLTLAAPNASEIIRTGGQVRCKDLILIGTSSNAADLRNTSGIGPWDLVDTTFSGIAPQVSLAATDINDWRSMQRAIQDGLTGAPLAGKRVLVLDKDAGTVVDAIADSEGLLAFGSGQTAGSVKARRVPSATLAWEDRGPFRVIVNDPTFADYDPGLETYDRKSAWLGRDNATGRQLLDVIDVIPLMPPPPPTGPIPTTAQPYFRDQDLPRLLEGPGSQDISHGTNTTRCYVNTRTREVGRGFAPLLVTERLAYIKTGSLPGLEVGDVISMGAFLYRAAAVEQTGDGAMTAILLAVD